MSERAVGDRPLVAVLDYGIGNLHSAQKAIEKMGGDVGVESTPGEGTIAHVHFPTQRVLAD